MSEPETTALLREAIEIIEEEREIYFESFRVPGTKRIPDDDARADIRKMDRWLRRAKAATR